MPSLFVSRRRTQCFRWGGQPAVSPTLPDCSPKCQKKMVLLGLSSTSCLGFTMQGGAQVAYKLVLNLQPYRGSDAARMFGRAEATFLCAHCTSFFGRWLVSLDALVISPACRSRLISGSQLTVKSRTACAPLKAPTNRVCVKIKNFSTHNCITFCDSAAKLSCERTTENASCVRDKSWAFAA